MAKKMVIQAKTKNAEEIPALYRAFHCEISDCEGNEDEGFFYKCTFFKGLRSERTLWIESDLLYL